MSRVSLSDLAYDIEQLYIEGYGPKSIAMQLECPIEFVYDWIEQMNLGECDESTDPYDTINS